MTAFVQTIIGALAAIGGGMLTAWWQEQHATETARRIRREERREEALRAFHAKTIEIVERIDQDYRAAENDPGAWREAWESAYPTVDELRKLWESDASGKIPEESITARYLEVRGQVHDCIGRFGTPDRTIASAEAKDFVRDAGRLLMLLGELSKETRSRVDELLAQTTASKRRGRRRGAGARLVEAVGVPGGRAGG